MSDTVYWIWLATRLGAANRWLNFLIEKFSSPYEIYQTDSDVFEHMGLGDSLTAALSDKDLSEAYEIADYCTTHRIGILTYDNSAYPDRLRSIKDPPALLYFKGTLPDFTFGLSVGMVGTRKMSEYGKKTAYKIGYELASAGVNVISGMALGIDAVSESAAIAAGGKTVAVLGCGVDVVYPKEHTLLYKKIIENGAVISEYPPTTRPAGVHFPIRNRIISGLSNGLLVVECDVKSGAMISARSALEQGRDLFAVPGNVGNKGANGTNMLLHDGANFVLTSEDVLRVYDVYYGDKISYINLSCAKAHSDLDENVLSSFGVCSRGAYDDHGKTETEVAAENRLRPKKAEKMTHAELPSTEKTSQNADKVKAESPKPKANHDDYADLSADEKKMLEALPDDRAIGIDALMRQGFPCSDAMAILAMLEIKGLVSSLPGGLYIKN